jgi:hypothetical protein
MFIAVTNKVTTYKIGVLRSELISYRCTLSEKPDVEESRVLNIQSPSVILVK